VLKPDGLILVDFASPTCPTCRAAEAHLRRIAEAYSDRVRVFQMGVTTTEEWKRCEVTSTPTVICFLREREVCRRAEPFSYEDLNESVGRVLKEGEPRG